MRVLFFISLFWLAGLAPAQSQTPGPRPDMDWELIEHSTFTWPGIDHMACATDSLANVVCVELRWDENGYLNAFLTIVYNDDLEAGHDDRKLPDLVYSNRVVETFNKLLEWERFLGNTIIPKYIDGTRVTWRNQVSEFEYFNPYNKEKNSSFYHLSYKVSYVNILSYLDDGREIVSTLSLEGLAPILDQLLSEAQEAAPANARWTESQEKKSRIQDTLSRFDRKYGITEEDMEETGQKREERLQALREKVQRLKRQQQQDSGGN